MPLSHHFLPLCFILVGHTLSDPAVNSFVSAAYMPDVNKFLARPVRPAATQLGDQSFGKVPVPLMLDNEGDKPITNFIPSEAQVVSSGAEAKDAWGKPATFVNREGVAMEWENLKSELHQFKSQIGQREAGSIAVELDVLEGQKQGRQSLWALVAGAAASVRLWAFLAGSAVCAMLYFTVSKFRFGHGDVAAMELNLWDGAELQLAGAASAKQDDFRDGAELQLAGAPGLTTGGRSRVPMMKASSNSGKKKKKKQQAPKAKQMQDNDVKATSARKNVDFEEQQTSAASYVAASASAAAVGLFPDSGNNMSDVQVIVSKKQVPDVEAAASANKQAQSNVAQESSDQKSSPTTQLQNEVAQEAASVENEVQDVESAESAQGQAQSTVAQASTDKKSSQTTQLQNADAQEPISVKEQVQDVAVAASAQQQAQSTVTQASSEKVTTKKVALQTQWLPRLPGLPRLPRPEYLDGTLAGDVGFDPLSFVEKFRAKLDILQNPETGLPFQIDIFIKGETGSPSRKIDLPFGTAPVPPLDVNRFSIFLGPHTKDTKRSLMWMREAEIKHARLAMLAAAGWPLEELWHGAFSKLLGSPFLLDVTQGRALSVLNGGLGEVSSFLLLVALGISVVECSTLDQVEGLTATGKTMKPDGQVVMKSYVPGDCGFDPLGLYGWFGNNMAVMDKMYADSDPQIAYELLQGNLKEMEMAEIKNGRLAMLAITGFAMQEFVWGTPVVDQSPIFFTFFGDILAPGALQSLGLF